MIISPNPQRSKEWHDERLSLPTASCFEKIVTSKGDRSETRKAYLYELAGERKSGRPARRFVTAKMKRAVLSEPDARIQYELINDIEVVEVGLCYKDEQKKYGASPDGLIGEKGMLEIKDAEPHIQIKRYDVGWPKSEHWQQIQGGLFVTGRMWCDLMSYCEGMEPLIIRYERDYEFLEKLEYELNEFCYDLAIFINKINNR